MSDAAWWHQVFAAFPQGYSVVAFDVDGTGPALRLNVDGVGVDIYGWRIWRIAQRRTQPQAAAAALVFLIDEHRANQVGAARGVIFEPEASKVRNLVAKLEGL